MNVEVLNTKRRHTDSSSSDFSLNTSDILRDLEKEFGENNDDVDSSSSVISLLGEPIPVIQRDVCKNNIIKTDQLSINISAPLINYRVPGLAGASDVDNEGTDSEICEINAKVKYSTIKDAVYVPPMYPVRSIQSLPPTNKDSTRSIETEGNKQLPNSSQHVGPITDSGKTSCSSFSSDEVCDISLLTGGGKSTQQSRPSSNNSWTTSSSSLEGDIESFVDEDLGEESDNDVDTNRTITKMTRTTVSTRRSTSHHNGIHSSASPLDSKDQVKVTNAVTPISIRKSQYYSPTSSSSEASLVDVKSKMIRHLAEKLSIQKDDSKESLKIINVKKTDENATNFFARKLTLLRTKPMEIKSPALDGETKDVEIGTVCEDMIPTTWIDRLQLKTFQAKLGMLTTNPIHNPRKCIKCRKASDKVDKKNVLRSLLLRAQRPLIEENIDDHLITHNSVTLIGELARHLSKAQQQEASKLN